MKAYAILFLKVSRMQRTHRLPPYGLFGLRLDAAMRLMPIIPAFGTPCNAAPHDAHTAAERFSFCFLPLPPVYAMRKRPAFCYTPSMFIKTNPQASYSKPKSLRTTQPIVKDTSTYHSTHVTLLPTNGTANGSDATVIPP